MTNLGTFWEGLIVVLLALGSAIVSSLLDIPWLMTAAGLLLALGLTYMGGGSAGKTEAIRKLSAGRPSERIYLSRIVRS